MLSNAIASVEKLVDGCGKYRALHKHHKCNTCGLYGHIAADCQVICSNCGGKHLQKHCIGFIADQLKTLVNSLQQSFVRDYNRTRKILNFLENRPVVYTHVIPDSCVRLTLAASEACEPSIHKLQETKFVWLDVTKAYEELPFSKRFLQRVTGNQEKDIKWILPSAEAYANEQIDNIQWCYQSVPGRVTLEHVSREIHPVTYTKCKPGERIVDPYASSAHWCMLFRINYTNKVSYIPNTKYTIRRGNDLKIQEINTTKVTDHLRHKLKSYNALATDFSELEKMKLKLESLRGKRLELITACDELVEKYKSIQSKYNDKKLKAITSLKAKTKVVLEHEKAYVKSKVKHLQKKLDNLQTKVDQQYARKDALYMPSNEEREDSQRNLDRVREFVANNPGYYCEIRTAKNGLKYAKVFFKCMHCQNPLRINVDDFGDPYAIPCIRCNKCTWYNYPHNISEQLRKQQRK